MKHLILGIVLCFTLNIALAQSDDAFWTFSGYQFGSGKTVTDAGTNPIGENFNHVLGRLDIVDYSDGMTAYCDGSLLAVLVSQLIVASNPDEIENRTALGSIIELGYGFSLNNNNPISISSSLEAQITLGFAAGYRGFVAPPNYTETHGGVIIGPEIGSLISLGDNVVFAPKFGYSPLINKGVIGSRVVFEVNTMLKVFSWLGVSVTPSFERFNFKKTEEVAKYSGKFSSFRIGLCLLNL